MKPLLILLCSLYLIGFHADVLSAKPDSTAQNEIQLLIDVSGSMKQNDPQNQRIDATKLLINLLPDKTNVTIWLFAEKTAVLTHTDAVDAAWKQQALQTVKNIHSRGVYTDIEKALQNTLDQGFKGNAKKHLILLTDGLVDISKDIMVSADSRERILSLLIPILQQKNINVNTIALSNQADKELLHELAFATNGWAEATVSADQLERVFAKTLLKAEPRDQVPIRGNRFTIDNKVKEFSLLVFKQTHSTATRLYTPEQTSITKQDSSKNIAWLETASYDLVTIKQPRAGEWRLEAAVDPDDQVIVMTDLQLHIEDTPGFVMQNDKLALKAYFTEQSQLIIVADFLSLVNLNVSLDQQAPQALVALPTDIGYFSQILSGLGLGLGKHQLTIQADGKTFSRELHREFEVIAELITAASQLEPNSQQVTIKLSPNLTVIDPSTLSISATINRADKAPETQLIVESKGNWSFSLELPKPGNETLINFSVTAKNKEGQALNPLLKPLHVSADALIAASKVSPPAALSTEPAETTTTATPPSEVPKPAATPDPANQPENSAAPTASQTAEANTEVTPAEPATQNWLTVSAIVFAANLVVFSIGYFLYRRHKKAKLTKQMQILERLS